LEESVSRYLSQLDTADLQDPSETLDAEEGADQGETGEAEIGDGQAGGDRATDAGRARSADLVDPILIVDR
jgi:hypothetical protein